MVYYIYSISIVILYSTYPLHFSLISNIYTPAINYYTCPNLSKFVIHIKNKKYAHLILQLTHNLRQNNAINVLRGKSAKLKRAC